MLGLCFAVEAHAPPYSPNMVLLDEKQRILMQGRQSMVGGVGTATEDEEDVNPAEARKWIQQPDLLLNLQGSPILEKVRR